MAKDEKTWSCPKCGHEFMIKNTWHSCGNYDLEHHFQNKDPIVRELFERFKKIVESCGRITWYPQKTRIVFLARMRFASCQTRKSSLRCGLIIPAKYPNAKNLVKIETYGHRSYGHYFNMKTPEDLDGAFADLVREAFLAG